MKENSCCFDRKNSFLEQSSTRLKCARMRPSTGRHQISVEAEAATAGPYFHRADQASRCVLYKGATCEQFLSKKQSCPPIGGKYGSFRYP